MSPASRRFHRRRTARRLLAALPLLAAVLAPGCGEQPPSTVRAQAELDAAAAKALRDIALDTSVSDEETLSRYLARMPDKPTVFPDAQPWARVEKDGDGWRIVVRRLDRVYLARQGSGTHVNPLQIERDGIRDTARCCERLLTDLGPRHLTSVRVTLVGSSRMGRGGEPVYVDLLEITATAAHLPALAKAQGPATKGSEFDPRSDAFGALFVVHANRYPEVTYTVRR